MSFTEEDPCHIDLELKIIRPEGIRVRYTTHEGVTDTIKFAGVTARLFQHGYDSLLGISYTDRVSDLTYKNAIKKRAKTWKKQKLAS